MAESRNPQLHVCNVKEKGVVLRKDLFEIFEILEHSFLPKRFQKVSVVEFLVRWDVDCGHTNLPKGNSPTYVFLESFQSF